MLFVGHEFELEDVFVFEVGDLFVVEVLVEGQVYDLDLVDDFFDFGFVEEVEETFHDVEVLHAFGEFVADLFGAVGLNLS